MVLIFVVLCFIPASIAAEEAAIFDDTAVFHESNTDDEDEEASALNISFGGVFETVHGVQLMKPFHYSVSRISAKLFTEVLYQNTSAKIAAGAEYNYCNPARTRFHLDEAYCVYRADNWDFSVGRQFIVWGQADGFRLTDRFTAQNMTEITAVTDKNSASDCLRFRVLHDIFTFETIAVPFFTPDSLPPFSFEKKKTPYAIVLPRTVMMPAVSKAIPIYYEKGAATMPRKFIDTELGVRLSFFLQGIDFSFSGFYGWDKTPYFVKSGYVEKKLLNPARLHNLGQQPLLPLNPYIPASIHTRLTPEYGRIGMAGFDMAVPVDPLVIRFESAYIHGRYFEPKAILSEEQLRRTLIVQTPEALPLIFNSPFKKQQLLLLAGLDVNKDGWSFSTQYFEDIVFAAKDELERPIHEGAVSLNLSKMLLRDRLKVSASGIIGINYGDTASYYSISYSLSDLLTVSCGADVYTKGYDGKGRFGILHETTSGWIKASVHF